MDTEKSKKIWKIRTVKNYPEAHNHVFVGEVLEVKDSYIKLNCRTFHFGRNVNAPKDIRVGNIGIRIIPWNRVEIINDLEPTFNYKEAQLKLTQEKVVLWDGKSGYVIASSFHSRY